MRAQPGLFPALRTILTAVAWLFWIANGEGATGEAGQQPASPFSRCEPGAGRVWTYDQLMCLRQVGTEQHRSHDVRRRLLALGAGSAEHPWPTLVLAHATLDLLQREEAIALYERAADGFARAHEAEGEVIARQNLANQLRLRGDPDGAARHVQRAVASAEASGQQLTIARAAVIEAVHSLSTGGDIGRAHRVLVRADRLAGAGAPVGLRRTILFNLANANIYLGRLEEALDALDRHRALRGEDQSLQNAATVELNRLVAQTELASQTPSAALRDALIAEGETIIAFARGVRDPLVEAQTHKVVGDLLASSDAARAAAHLARCLALERTLGFPGLRTSCLWSLAQIEARRDPARAERVSQEALSLIGGDGDRLLLAYAWQARLRLLWRTLPTDAAIEQSLEALDAIERLRTGQEEPGGRAALFATWTRDYQWLTGQLLELQPARLTRAFEVGERLRARVLLEQLAYRDSSRPAEAGRHGAATAVSQRIADTQRRLLEPALASSERRPLLAQLQLLEWERQDLASGRFPALTADTISFASLDAVQRALGDGEAMIWFSIAPWTDLYGEFGGGSWALVVTRGSVTAERLAATADIHAQAAALAGLARDRSTDVDSWSRSARHLRRILFEQAIARLPPAITRLAVIADGPVHRVPVEALPLDDGTMLGERFDVSVAPSATVWLRLRSANTPQRSRGGLLVVADPDVAGGSPDGELQLTALPGARREARSIARLVGVGPKQLVEGASATERFVKDTPLGPFAIVHFAAHARADSAAPERSAVFLAAGDSREDGWLQPAEIAALDFTGSLVVLSACDSAEGALLSGEGPLSLARAFFAGGAGAVVATRWPLRDDDAVFVMERFYRALRSGQRADGALAVARREARESGLPPAAWAGITLLGDGQLSPLMPQGGLLPLNVDRRQASIAMAAAAIGFGCMVWRWRRRTARTPEP